MSPKDLGLIRYILGREGGDTAEQFGMVLQDDFHLEKVGEFLHPFDVTAAPAGTVKPLDPRLFHGGFHRAVSHGTVRCP